MKGLWPNHCWPESASLSPHCSITETVLPWKWLERASYLNLPLRQWPRDEIFRAMSLAKRDLRPQEDPGSLSLPCMSSSVSREKGCGDAIKKILKAALKTSRQRNQGQRLCTAEWHVTTLEGLHHLQRHSRCPGVCVRISPWPSVNSSVISLSANES